MAGNIYRTSRGDAVDMDNLRLNNEKTIAIGNMKVNARGDELGPGGKIIKTRSEVMQEYHQLNTAVADEDTPVGSSSQLKVTDAELELEQSQLLTPTASDQPIGTPEEQQEQIEQQEKYSKPRGSFAASLAKETEVNQELLEPASKTNTDGGISRI